MPSKPKSRWADTEEDAALEAKKKRQKEEKKRLKAEKARRIEEEDRKAKEAGATKETRQADEDDERPAKRRKVTPDRTARDQMKASLRGWAPCRSAKNYKKLNDIEEGTYGHVSRAKDVATGRIVALKRLKLDAADRNGMPVTALREIRLLRMCDHRNVVKLIETVVGDSSDSPNPSVSLVLEFVEHDLRTVLEDMTEPFLPSEIKQLVLQLTSGLSYLHENYILHRDLKTANLLLNNKGLLKIADFGMARRTSDPPPTNLTTLVVTLWYRAPELLLGAKTYTSAIDMWSVGCIFAELLEREALFRAYTEAEQISKIFEVVGVPTDDTWPGFRRLPNAKSLKLPRKTKKQSATEDRIRPRFPDLTSAGCALLRDLLSLNPDARPTAAEMLEHPYFQEKPKPKAEALFPTFPSKASQERRPRKEPHAPVRGAAVELGEVDVSHLFASREGEAKGAGFRLRMA